MPDIFQYSDYRKYLYDWYQEKLNKNPSVSYRLIAKRIGYKSPGYLSMLIGGKIGMSLSMGMKFAAYMKLKKRETEYFQYMILFGEAKTREEKLDYFDKLRELPEEIYRLNHLEKLYLNYNKLKSLPRSIYDIRLTELPVNLTVFVMFLKRHGRG